MAKNHFYSLFCLFSSAGFWVWCNSITREAAVWAINSGIEPLTKILWQNQVLLYVHGRAAAQPWLGFSAVLLVVPMWDGWKDALLPPVPTAALCGTVSPFMILLTWPGADGSLLHCTPPFRLCLQSGYPELLLKATKQREELVHMSLCEEG